MTKTWIVDIDSTVALMNGRDPFDWSRVGEDLPNEPVIRVVRALQRSGDLIVFMSGRMEQARKQTELWLDVNVGFPFHCGLFMRADDDYRPDNIVKRELYDNHILGHYDVAGVLDDRDSVVAMWRKDLGLTCLQVNYGAF